MITENEIVRDPQVIFRDLPLPITLREHLIRVAAVADTIIEHWRGPALNRDRIVAACLVHDVANILKINFDSPEQHEFLARDRERLPAYRAAQQALRDTYGTTDTVAVRTALLAAHAVDPTLIAFTESSRGPGLQRMLADGDFEGMIYLYADNRVLPNGIGTLADRIADAKLRYPGYYERPERKAMHFEQRLWDMEAALQAHTTVPLNSITDATIAHHPLWRALDTQH